MTRTSGTVRNVAVPAAVTYVGSGYTTRAPHIHVVWLCDESAKNYLKAKALSQRARAPQSALIKRVEIKPSTQLV